MRLMASYWLIRYTHSLLQREPSWGLVKKSIDGSRHMTMRSGLQNKKNRIIRIYIKMCISQKQYNCTRYPKPDVLGLFARTLILMDQWSGAVVWFAHFHPAYCNLVCTGTGTFCTNYTVNLSTQSKMQTVNNERLLNTFLLLSWNHSGILVIIMR